LPVRVLLDECLPRRLKRVLGGHDAKTAPEMGWASKRNGELLALAVGQFEVFLTADRNLSYQQDASSFDIAIVVLVAPSKDAPPASAVSSPAHLYLRGRDFVLRDLSPSDLQALGIDVRRPEYSTAEEQLAFIGYGEQNREGGLEFRFSGEKLRAFYGRCHLWGRCDFELSWPSRDRFRLPISEEHLSSVLDPAVSVRDYSAH
jgi:hypothetical protein